MGRTSRKIRMAVGLATAAMVGALVASPHTAGAAPLDPWTCSQGAFCVYSGDNGTGKVCGWQIDDPDWMRGSSVCSWAKKTRVQSAFNNGTTGKKVSAYTAAGYKGTKAVCLSKGKKVNLRGAGTYLRSHTWKC